MDGVEEKNTKRNGLKSAFSVGVVFSFAIALTSYINSSAISEVLPEDKVGILYSIGSLISLIGIFVAPFVLSKLGNKKIIRLASMTLVAVFFGLSLSQGTTTFPILIPIMIAVNSLIGFSLDIFVEKESTNETTGKLRGLFLTLQNIGWIAAPFLSGLVAEKLGFNSVYAIAGTVALGFTIIAFSGFKNFKDPLYEKISFTQGIKTAFANKNRVFALIFSFLLNLFYATMVVYTPLYLHAHVGISWEIIGILFTIMLLPFLLQYSFGLLADKYIGEKELMAAGFSFMAVATLLVPQMMHLSIVVIGIILFISRLGASAVESMSEIYFFKQIEEKDSHAVSVFRAMNPLAYIIGPIIASQIIHVWSFETLFYVMAIITASGIAFALLAQDTK